MAVNYYYLLCIAKVSYCKMSIKPPCELNTSTNFTSLSQQVSFSALYFIGRVMSFSFCFVCIFAHLSTQRIQLREMNEEIQSGHACWMCAFVPLCVCYVKAVTVRLSAFFFF